MVKLNLFSVASGHKRFILVILVITTRIAGTGVATKDNEKMGADGRGFLELVIPNSSVSTCEYVSF